MGRKHKHPEHENLERWLVSYADFITLLFATFVVLYALGQLDLAKLKEVRHSLQQAFNPSAANPAAGITGQTDGVMPGSKDASILNDSGNSILDKVATSPQDIHRPKNPTFETMTQSVKQANTEIAKLNAGDKAVSKGANKGTNNDANKAGDKASQNAKKTVEKIPEAKITIQERGIVITLPSTLFFDPGSAGLKSVSYKVLDKLAASIRDSGRTIHVEGHTDSEPIATSIYPSNWELSSARASSVLRYLANKHHVPITRLAAIGYGQSRPAGNNFSFGGRQQNRRVDIVLLSDKAQQIENPKETDFSKEADSKVKKGQDKSEPVKPAHAVVKVAGAEKIPAATLQDNNLKNIAPAMPVRISLEKKSQPIDLDKLIPDIRPANATPASKK